MIYLLYIYDIIMTLAFNEFDIMSIPDKIYWLKNQIVLSVLNNDDNKNLATIVDYFYCVISNVNNISCIKLYMTYCEWKLINRIVSKQKEMINWNHIKNILNHYYDNPNNFNDNDDNDDNNLMKCPINETMYNWYEKNGMVELYKSIPLTNNNNYISSPLSIYYDSDNYYVKKTREFNNIRKKLLKKNHLKKNETIDLGIEV